MIDHAFPSISTPEGYQPYEEFQVVTGGIYDNAATQALKQQRYAGLTQDKRAEWDSAIAAISGGDVTDVNSPIPAILSGYDDSEALRAERVKLLKATASYALGAKIAADLAAATPPTNADELAAIKAEAKSQASTRGGDFFDAYFAWIGAYREGGGPGFLAAVTADQTTDFLGWATPANGITLPDGTVVLPEGGIVRDLFTHFLT